jgi:hypothetical protein
MDNCLYVERDVLESRCRFGRYPAARKHYHREQLAVAKQSAKPENRANSVTLDEFGLGRYVGLPLAFST